MSKEELELKILELKKELPMLCDGDYYRQCSLIQQLEEMLEELKGE